MREMADNIGKLSNMRPAFSIEHGIGERIVADISKMCHTLTVPAITFADGLATMMDEWNKV